MPLRAGQADKLGNRYEGVWTVDSLLDLFSGAVQSVIVEPIGEESAGVEFLKSHADGIREFHSAKRQTSSNIWSLADLTRGSSPESILGSLWTKLRWDPRNRVKFVSGTTANTLNELTEQARRSATLENFQAVLDQAEWRPKDFEKYLLPLAEGQPEKAFDFLRRTEVVGITENMLIHHVEQRIRTEIRRSDGGELDPHSARLLIADVVFDRLGQPIDRQTLLAHLAKHGFAERDLSNDRTIHELIARRNENYIRRVETELILGAQIERAEAKRAFDCLTGDGRERRVVIVGTAGQGKSCVLAQTVRLLCQAACPVVVLRMDIQTRALTSDALGTELGYPASPAAVLARVAGGKRGVLVLDQLDALSFASGRNQGLWDAFEELLDDAARAPNIRVLLACRRFDAEHDSRLRSILSEKEKTLRIDLDLLSLEGVTEVLSKASCISPRFTKPQLELLRTPLHLSLYLQGDTTPGEAFGTVQDLFGRYWNRKQELVSSQLGRESRWIEVLRKLSNWVSEHQTLSAPVDILDDWPEDRQAMASQCVLDLDDHTCRFFHESFFDYAFARLFVAEGGRLCDLLLCGNEVQHLFRRAQVRQVLTYERGRNFDAYLSDLQGALEESSIRFHIKKHVLDWLRGLDRPTVDEWRLLQCLEQEPKLARFVRLVPHNSAAWFKVLREAGTWSSWLDSADENLVNHAIWLMSLPEVMKHASSGVAELIAERMDDSELWRRRFIALTFFGSVHHSREMFNLFLRALKSGWFDGTHEDTWYGFLEMAKEKPDLGCEFIAAFVERLTAASVGDNPFAFGERDKCPPAEFIHELEKVPEEFARRLLPPVAAAVLRTQITLEDGEVEDHVDAFLALHEESDFKSALFGSLQRALGKLAAEKPKALDQLLAPYELLRHRIIEILLLRGWSKNGPHFANKAVEYLLQAPHRLLLGYFMWSSGNGLSAIAREVIRAVTPHCTLEKHHALEVAIMGLRVPEERKRPGPRGYRKMLLLECLSKSRMGKQAKAQLQQLLEKFPGTDFSLPTACTCSGSFVPSPISSQAMQHMSDEHWLSAMRKYSAEQPRTPENWSKGDIHTLCNELVWEAQANKPRFSALALSMPSDVSSDYFRAILNGLAETHGPLPEERKAKAIAPGELDLPTLFAVIRRLDTLPNRPCGRVICWVIGHLASWQWPDEVLEIVAYYALNDPDPKEDLGQTLPESNTNVGGGAEFVGFNCVRGAAAHATAELLFKDQHRWPRLEPLVRKLATDRALAVRAATVECLIALLNVDRDESIRLFRSLVDGVEKILSGRSVDHFLHHAACSHYTQVRMILISMLKSDDENARKTAGRQIAVAAFHSDVAKQDLATALTCDETCRAAVAEVFAFNLACDEVHEVCRHHLRLLFNDDSKNVRQAAGGCFGKLSSQQLSEERDLIYSFIESSAFYEGIGQLLFALRDSTARKHARFPRN